MQDEQHWNEVDRLWRAVKRDLGSAILEMSGFGEDTKAMTRLAKTWDKLCDLDINAAAKIHHGVEEISMMMARSGKVEEHKERQFNEIAGLADLAREKHPDTKVETLGELINLADESIREDIDRETGEDK